MTNPTPTARSVSLKFPRLAERISARFTFSRGWAHLAYPEMMELVDISVALGALVVSVTHQGLFDRLGIKPGDIIRSVNNKRLLHSGQMLALLFAVPLPQSAQLGVWRAGQMIEKHFSHTTTD
jgi:S1-C subfamily serine protease